MAGLQSLPPAARTAVVMALRPAEPIVFVTMPKPAEAARAALPTAAAGALLTALAGPIAWIAVSAALGILAAGGDALVPLAMAAIAVPGLAVGLTLMLAPHAAARRARDTIVLVTDRRLMLLSLSGKAARTLPARAILGVERQRVERGHGTIEVRHEALAPTGGDAAETVLSGIDDVLAAEAAIRQLSFERDAPHREPVD